MGLSWLLSQKGKSLFSIGGKGFDLASIVMLAGGLFLIYKSVMEIHHKLEGEDPNANQQMQKKLGLGQAIGQIILIDAVFSFDSIITAGGTAKHVEIMIAAVVIAMRMTDGDAVELRDAAGFEEGLDGVASGVVFVGDVTGVDHPGAAGGCLHDDGQAVLRHVQPGDDEFAISGVQRGSEKKEQQELHERLSLFQGTAGCRGISRHSGTRFTTCSMRSAHCSAMVTKVSRMPAASAISIICE